ncbi:unnamed protein product [Peniophora sp. CBMAI 1063]|nr:unnamed protein product [Peniophora sp. CBMAI 1063]
MLFSLLALPALVAGLPSLGSRQDNVHHLPLARQSLHRRGDFVDVKRVAGSARALRAKYGFAAANQLARRADEPASIDVINQGGDLRYLATLNVGTPPQPLNVILDTGSSDLWFSTTDCQNCPNYVPRFNASQSSTLNASSTQTVELLYGTGLNATGTVLQDAVAVGPYSTTQAFTGVTEMYNTSLINGTTSGIFGLAFQNLTYSGIKPFWLSLFDDGELDSPEFGMYLTDYQGNTTDLTAENPGGTLTLGGTNSSLYKGEIEYIPFNSSQDTFWFQNVSGLTVNGASVELESNGTLAIMDTGSALIAGPTAAVKGFWAQINGSQALPDIPGFYGFPCETNFTATLAFGGKAWPIPARDMNAGEIAEGQCLGIFFDAQQGLPAIGSDYPSWIVGDAFLKNVYMVYRAGDNPAVGYAELADGLRAD